MRVLVFGTGGVGSIYAYILAKGGAHITTVCRSNYTAVSQHGISISSALFGEVSFRPSAVVRSVDETDSQDPFDYILICSKAFPGTAALVHAAVTPAKTALVLCQNGIGIEHEYAELYPRNTIISGVVYLPTTQTAPGLIKMGPLQKLQLGTYPAAPSAAAAKAQVATLVAAFAAGGGICEHHDDVQQARWVKLAVNVAWNPTCALTLCDDANLFRSSSVAEETIVLVMREVAAVAKAAGYLVTDELIAEQLQRPRKRLETGGKEPSMLTDVRENRALEVDAILGNCVAIAQKLGVEAPRLGLLFMLAKALNFSIVKDKTWRDIA